MTALLGAETARLAERLAELGQPAYRAKQLGRWIYQQLETDFQKMTDLPAALRDALAAACVVTDAELARVHTSRDGTLKLLIRTADGRFVETVMIPDGTRRTACLSSQVGCPVGCVFCASGLGGLVRNLTTGEILAQVLLLNRLLAPQRLTNLVFMGMGEPLLNTTALLDAIRALTDPERFGIGARRITVSTVGIAGRLARLAEAGPQVGLALSLHAPTDALRAELIPYPQRATVRELVEAASAHQQRTGRRVTIEYVLLAGRNDQPRHARLLAQLLAGRKFLVNLIPWNAVPQITAVSPPTSGAARRFADELERARITVTIRRQRGDDIAAACGQLAGSEAG